MAANEWDIAQAEALLAEHRPEVVIADKKGANFLALVKVAAIMVMLK